jgi:type II secretory ATPase GspE/PulE/Tfp pilus assembly ATPase PilB-like protein
MDRAFLSIISAAGRRDVPIGQEPLTIGRHAQNKIVITDPQASRFHCVVERTPRGIVVRDLDSRNGTKLNGQPVTTTYFTVQDVLSIGATQIRMVLPGVPRKQPARPASAKADADQVDISETRPSRRALKQLENVEPVEPAPADDPSPADEPLPIDLALPEDDLVVNFLAAEAKEQGVDFGLPSTSADDEEFLPVLAESLPDRPFEVADIALVNCRGQVVHAAEGDNPQKRKVAGSGEAVGVLRYIILICTRARASDIHLEPKNEDYQLRLRIDGNMVDVVRLSKSMGVKLGALVKIMCDIDVQYRNIVQEGHFTSYVPGRRIDYRVSFAPAMFGQKMVIRILDTTTAPVHAADLRMPVWMTDQAMQTLKLDQGMILVCGPTGSGKTTTLYALLRDVGTDHRNVVTIEDPVEIEIEGATQVPVSEDKGNTFPVLLRSMLRQDPDVMMIGEIRDGETARIAMQAAMTGHLVFSTLHTKDSIGTVFRLLDLGVEPYLISASLHIVISQRLARELCPYCKKGIRPKPEQIKKMGRAGLTGVNEIFIPVGCPKCLRTGFAGRRAFFEMLITNEDVRELILKNPTPRQIEEALRSSRFMKLEETGYQLVAQGVTVFEEIERSVGK